MASAATICRFCSKPVAYDAKEHEAGCKTEELAIATGTNKTADLADDDPLGIGCGPLCIGCGMYEKYLGQKLDAERICRRCKFKRGY